MSSGHGGSRPGAGAKKGSGWSPEAKERNRLRRLGLVPEAAAPESNVVQMREEVEKAASTERGSMQSRRAIAALEYVGRKRAVVSPFRLPEFPPQAVPKDKKLRMAMDSAGSWADGQYAQFAGTIMANVVGSGLVFLGYPFLSELALRPEYRVISETIADDATRKWIDFDVVGEEADEDREKEKADEEQALLRGQPIDADERKNRREDRVKKAGKTDKVKELRDDQERLALRDNMYSVCRNDGFFGRSHLFLNFGQDWDNISDLDELKTPIGDGRDETSKGKVTKGSFTEVVVAEPVWTYPTTYNAINPLRKDFYNPQVWYVQGMEIHCTRLLKFIGHEVPDLLKPSFAFGGLSLSQIAKPYVDIWLQTRESVGQLIHSFSVMVLKTDLQTILQGTSAADLEARVNAFNALRDNAGTFVVNKDTEDFANVSASLSGLHELQAQSQEHMMSCVRIPATKFTGIQPSGLQTTSEGEIRAYYDTIAAYQNRFMRPNLTRVVNFQQLSLWGEIDPGITFDFEPLWETSEKELKELQKMEAERHQVYVDLGAISNEEVRGIIIDDPKLPYGHLDPEDVPDLRQEEEEGLEPEGGRPDPLAEAGPGLGQAPDAAAGGQEKPGGGGGKGGGSAPKGGPGGSGAGENPFPPLNELAGENDNSPFSMARDAGFSESDHPRAPDGRFGSKPGQHGGEGPGHASGAGGLTSAGAGWKGPGPFPWWMEGLGGRGEESFVPAAKPVDPSKLKRVGPQMGSNPGGVFQTQDGDRLYVKQGKTKDHVRNEVTAAALYRLAGAPTLTYRPVEGGGAVATVMEKLDKDNASKLSPEEIKRARRDFATHAWLANYDAVGTGGDNLVTIHGVPTAVDLGGALEYRARGAPKGDQFGDKVAEIDTMRDPHIAPDASRIFKGITAAEFRESAQRVAAVTDAEIRETVAEHGGKPELADKLIKRRDDVAERAKHFGSSGDPKKATSSIVFAAGDELPVKELNGVKFEAWTPPKDDWNDVSGQVDDLDGDDPLPEHLPKNKKLSSGLIIREPDGRIWLARPKNGFGGYAHTWPKGRVEPGLSLQANAIKEAYEETGLKGRVTGVAGTSEGDMTWTRYYFAERESGDPSKPGPESDGVVLAPADRLDEFLNRKRDRDMAKHFAGAEDRAIAFDWEEGKHPRGQPENKGQFGSGGGGGAQKPAPRQPQRQAPQRPAGAGGKVLAGREAKMAEQQQVFKRHLAEQMAKATPEQKAKHAKHVAKTREFFSGDGTRTATAAAVKGWIAKHAAGVAEHHLRAAVMMPVVHHAVEAAMEHVGLGAVPGATLAITAIAAYSVHHVMHEFNISLGGAKDLLVSTVKGIAATISGTAEVMSEVAQLEHRMMAGDAKPKADATGMLEPLLELLAGLEALSDEDDPFSDDDGGEGGKGGQAADEAPFEEGKHPRDKDGKFATSGSGSGSEHPETEEKGIPLKVQEAMEHAKAVIATGVDPMKESGKFWGNLTTAETEALVNHFGTGKAVEKAVTGRSEKIPTYEDGILASGAEKVKNLVRGDQGASIYKLKDGTYLVSITDNVTGEQTHFEYADSESGAEAKAHRLLTKSGSEISDKSAKVSELVDLYGEQLQAMKDQDSAKAKELADQIAEYPQDVKDAAWKIHSDANADQPLSNGAPAKGAKKTKFGGLWKETGNGEIADFAANSQIVLNKKAFGGSSYRQMLAFLVKKSEGGLADKTITDKLKAKLMEALYVAQAKAVSLGKPEDAVKIGNAISKMTAEDPAANTAGWSDYNANNGGAPVPAAAAQEPATVFNAAGVAKWSPKFYADAIKIGNKYGTGSLDSGLEKAKAAVAAGDATAEALEAMLTANEKYELDKYYGKGNGVKAAYTSAQEDVGLSSQAKEQSDFAKKLINQSKGPSEAAKAALANVTPEALKKAKKSTPIPSGMATSTAAQQLVDAFNAKYAGKDITDESALKQKIADYADLSDQVAKANAAWEKASAGEKQKAQAEAAAKAKEAQEAQVNAAKKQAAEAKAKHAEYMKELGISDAEADGFKGLVEMFGGKSKDLIADFQSYAKQAKNNLGGSGITGFEAALIANYKSSSQVNEELRKPSASWSASKWAYSKVLNSALSKLPKYNGVVIRNTPLTTDLQGRYKPGHVVLEHGFTGASDKKPHGVFSGNTRFYITAVGKRAASIKNAFGFEGEGEVLFQARTAFLVDKVEGTPGGSGDASYKVYMTEVEY